MLIERTIVRTLLRLPGAPTIIAHLHAAYPLLVRALQMTERLLTHFLLSAA